MISVLVFPFFPESSLFYIRMIVVPMGRCRPFVVMLVPPIGLMRISVVHPFLYLLSIVVCNGLFVFPLIFTYLGLLCVLQVSSEARVSPYSSVDCIVAV